MQSRGPAKILLGAGPLLGKLGFYGQLTTLGFSVQQVEALNSSTARDACFAADVGISGVEFLVAETGSIVVAASPTEPRSLSLLPVVHIAVATRDQLVPDLFDLLPTHGEGGVKLPSCLSIITGPSKTGDIELRLVTGVHGPGEVHVVLIDDSSAFAVVGS